MKPVPFYYAVHEAGHVVTEWLLGTCPHAVHLLAPGEEIKDRRGRMVRDVGGLVESGLSYNPYHLLGGPPAHTWLAEQPDETRRSSLAHGLAVAATLLAGPIAEARHRKVSLAWILMSGGRDDYESVGDIAVDLCAGMEGQRRFQWEADLLARRLLRGVMPAVVSLAGVLHRLDTLDGDRLRALLPRLLGPCPKFVLAAQPHAARLRAVGL